MAGPEVWSGFSADPRDLSVADLRATDADRDHAGDVVRDAFVDGRLARDEFDARRDAVLQNRTIGGFLPLISDLVPASTPATVAGSMSTDLRGKAVTKYQRELRDARNGWIFVTTVCVAIWGATSLAGGAYFFWPVFPSIGIGIGYFSLRLNSEQRIEAIEDGIAETRRTRRRRGR